MKKQDVCVRLTRKNCKKVLEILEMFGEKVFDPDATEWRVGKIWSNDTYAIFDIGSEWTGHTQSVKNTGYSDRIIIKPKELKQILAKEHLKVGDVVEIKGIFGDKKIAEILSISKKSFSFESLDKKSSGVYQIDDLNFLRYATDEEKAMLEPKTAIVTLNPVDTFTGSIPGQATYTREVWVNHYPNGKFDVFENKDIASFTSGITGQTVKAILTYDIPMTKV